MTEYNDTLRTTAAGFGGFWMSLMNWLPDVISLLIGLLTIFYLYLKIRKEF